VQQVSDFKSYSGYNLLDTTMFYQGKSDSAFYYYSGADSSVFNYPDDEL
jgi:hypothetical protein